LLRKVDRRTTELVSCAMIKLLQPVAALVHTITGDNGKEFAKHECISQELCSDFFFAHPYAAWERCEIENMNGLVSQYIPKFRDLNSFTSDELELIITKLNHRPRICLDFMSTFEVFIKHSVELTG
jgi:IS30 family transposase